MVHSIHTLSTPQLRLELAPHLGASIVNLFARVEGAWQPLLRHTSPQTLAGAEATHSASSLASFTLAPFSNRIPGATFAFGGREYHLRPTTPEGNAQHGDVRGRPHQLVSLSEERAEYLLDSAQFPDFNYPWPLTLRTIFGVEGGTATQTLELTNTGTQAMPAGLGLHPYFERHLGGASDVELCFSAEGFYPVDETFIPWKPMQPIPAHENFGQARLIGSQEFNTLYGGLDGGATLRYAGTPYRLDMQTDPVFSHLVLFTSPDGSLAVEPVSHATNAFNLYQRGVPDVGFIALEPGETLRGTVRFRFLAGQ